MTLSSNVKLLAAPAMIISSMLVGMGAGQASPLLNASSQLEEATVVELTEEVSSKSTFDVAALKIAGDKNGDRRHR